MSGGQSALDGFAAQATVATIEALRRDDWDTLQIEPTGNGTELEKVDIELRSAGKALLHVQVKKSKNLFKPADAKKWAAEVAAKSDAPEKKLTLVGRGSAPDDHAGVTIEMISSDEDHLRKVCVGHLLEALTRRERASPGSAAMEAAAVAITKALFWGSAKAATWTRGDIEALVADRCAPQFDTDDDGWAVALTRIVVVNQDLDDGIVDDYLAWTLTNQRPEARTIGKFQVRLVDLGDVQPIVWGDGLADPHPDREFWKTPNKSEFRMRLQVRGDIAPNESRTVALHVRRWGGIRRLGPIRIYDDPMLPIATRQSVDITVCFPVSGQIVAKPDADAGRSTVRWTANVDRDQREFTAHVTVEDRTGDPTEIAIHAARARALMWKAFGN
jgi:hypothetical protein